MRITVNTPAANIGRTLVEKLLTSGATVTIISRSPEKVDDLVKRGALLVAGSIDDAATLKTALEGADALFWLTPPPARPDYQEWGLATARQAAALAKQAGVKRTIVLSSLGAQNGRGSGPVGILLDVENAFKEALANVTILRPGFFMENLLRSIDTLAHMGTLFMPVSPDTRVPHVATSDIGNKAAEVLLDASWSGHRTLGVHGPRDLSYREVTEILSKALGKPVQYVQVSVAQAKQAMIDAKLPGFLVDIFTEMYQAIVDGRMNAAEPRSAETTTPTTLEDFAAKVIAPAVARASA